VLSISTDNIDLDLDNSDVPKDQSVSKCYPISTGNINLDLDNSDVPNYQSVSKCYQSRLVTLTSTLIILMSRIIKVSVSVINLD
jgi:hypothetical protein